MLRQHDAQNRVRWSGFFACLWLLAAASGRAGAEEAGVAVVGAAPDFGSVALDRLERIEVSFDLKNTGEVDLAVQRVVAGCGCVEVEWPGATTLQKGQQTSVRAFLDPLKAVPGPHKYGLQAITDQGAYSLGTVSYNYDSPAVVDPRTLWLRDKDGTLQAEAVLTVRQDVNVERLAVVAPPESHLVSEIVRDGRESRVRVRLAATRSPGEVDERVLVRAAGQSEGGYELRVRGRVPGPLRATPEVIVATNGVPDDAGRLVREIEVRHRTRPDARLDFTLATTSPAVTAEVIEKFPGGCRVRVRMDATATGVHEEIVTLQWGENGTEQSLPVRVVWKGTR